MSIKFRLTDPVRVTPTYHNDTISNIIFEIGPVINRARYGWSTYALILPNDTSLSHKLSVLDKYIIIDNKPNVVIVDYELFRKYFTNFQAAEIHDKFTSLSEDDLLDDLDFMHDEVAKIQIQMNIMKQKGEIERYNFYNDLISINMHKMFCFPTKDEFDIYVDKIRQITDRDKDDTYNQRVNEMKEIEKLVWS